MVAIGVLGPLELRGDDGAPVRVGSGRQRRLLAALALHAGAPVASGLLAELVWGAELPADPAAALQTNVARLRRLLPACVRITTTPDGYRLVADRSALDACAFTDLLAAVTTADEPQARLARLAAALRLWRGDPFPELDHPSVAAETARLGALRADAVEQQGAALLAAGRAGEAVVALEGLAMAEPLRESAVAGLMRALVAAGRQADALAAYARLRARLTTDLGLEPGPELRALQQQVLRQELGCDGAGEAGPARPRPAAPRVPISSFVGRDADVARVARTLVTGRVVTLTGPGGVGKTRLARHVAAAVAGRYDDGVLVVEFADGGAADVEPALAAALRVPDAGAGPLVDRIVEVLAVRRRLLLLDNCEHVAAEVALLVEAVTAGTTGVDVLATSREPLRVDGEVVLGVDPLGAEPAARLLVDRMHAGGQDPVREAEPAELVAEVCRRLDGLPLALELAAARAASLGLRGLLDALDRPLDALRGGRRTAGSRHRSLREVVRWSYELLDAEQRGLFARLSVFAGSVEHDAVVAVCGDADALPDLVQRSLVVRHPGEPARFGMLETLRAFGRSLLAADPVAAALRARHAEWALRLAEEIRAARRGPDEVVLARRFDTHLAELRRAHAWLCDNGPMADLLRLSVLFGELGFLRARLDLVRMAERSLAAAGVPEPGVDDFAPPGAAHPLVPRLLGLVAHSSWQRGDLAAAEARARQAIAAAEAAGDPAAASEGYAALGSVAGFRGDLVGQRRYDLRALELGRAAGDVEAQVMPLADLVLNAAYAGDDTAAGRYEAELVDLAARVGSASARAWTCYVCGERRAERGDPNAARYLTEAIAAAEEVDAAFVAGVARHTLLTSVARAAAGDPVAALPQFGPLLDHWHALGAWTQLWIAMRALTETLSRAGRHREVALLLGAERASSTAAPQYGTDSARTKLAEKAARRALGRGFADLLAAGAALGDSGALALARRLTRA
jgi:predicted ATPase/DNA-binding SARP family transcriptional activator